MHIAACNGYTGVVSFLVQQPSIDINIKDPNGNTALHLAAFFLHYETAMALLNAGASLDARNKCLQKPIVITEDTTMIRLLNAFEKHLQVQKAEGRAKPTHSVGRSTRDKTRAAARLSVHEEGKGLFTPLPADE